MLLRYIFTFAVADLPKLSFAITCACRCQSVSFACCLLDSVWQIYLISTVAGIAIPRCVVESTTNLGIAIPVTVGIMYIDSTTHLGMLYLLQ